MEGQSIEARDRAELSRQLTAALETAERVDPIVAIYVQTALALLIEGAGDDQSSVR